MTLADDNETIPERFVKIVDAVCDQVRFYFDKPLGQPVQPPADDLTHALGNAHCPGIPSLTPFWTKFSLLHQQPHYLGNEQGVAAIDGLQVGVQVGQEKETSQGETRTVNTVREYFDQDVYFDGVKEAA